MSDSNQSVFTSTPTARTAALALALLAGAGAVQAQSSYALTRLNPPFLGQTELSGRIDAQNRVTASVFYLTGYKLFGSPSGPVHTAYVARWPASTAASVGPAKLIAQPGRLTQQSQSGDKLLVRFSTGGDSTYDAVTRQLAPVPQGVPTFSSSQAAAINDGDTVVGVAMGGATNPASGQTLYAVRWAPGATAAPEALPVGDTINRGSATAINRQGVVTGMVGIRGEVDAWHAALWRESGAFEILHDVPDTASTPIALNEAGDVLIKLEKLTDETFIPRFAVVAQGVTTLIEPPQAGDRLSANDLSDSGAVVGTVAQAGAPEATRDRAFIWKNGVFSDLTTWVTAKGVRLPAGAVLSTAWSINAQGSILASLREANGKTSVVRLTAKP